MVAMLVFAFLSLLAAACEGPQPEVGTSSPSPLAVPEYGSHNPDSSPDVVELTVDEVARALSLSVVRIQTDTATPGSEPPYLSEFGSGIIIDVDGHIVTNNHVVTTGDGDQLPGRITVTLRDRRVLEARLVGRDRATDLAVLKVEAPRLKPAALGDSNNLQVGQAAVAIGYALDQGLAPTVTTGVVKATRRAVREGLYTLPDVIQTDAAINLGVSGGPLVNMLGEVVGINTAIIRGAPSVGFAISTAFARSIVDSLIREGRVARAYLGIGTAGLTAELSRERGFLGDGGLIVTLVAEGSPAQNAKLRENDILVSIGDDPVRNNGDLLAILAKHRAGSRIKIRLYRHSTWTTAEVTLGTRSLN